MSKNGATVWWIEADSGELRSHTLDPHDLLGSGTFENEVRIKYARNPVEIATILHARAGNDWERAELERLRDRAAEVRAEIARRQSPEKPIG